MSKKITAMLLAIGCISSTWTVQAADFSGGNMSATANQIVVQAEVLAPEYQELKKEAKKYADSQEVTKRAQAIKEETAQIREKALKEAARKAEQKRVAKRQEVADFAVQFVGNPYVYGGTSLTNGADCSGFVMSVFAAFGYELPRVAAAQFGASEKKTLSQLEVGDLVFYGNGISHVALYIGNGKVVHALNSSKGIVITDYNYDTPVGVGSYME